MSFLTPLERIVLESLNHSSKDLNELSSDLGTNSQLIYFLLQKLASQGFITLNNNKFRIDPDNKQMIQTELKSQSSRSLELKILFENIQKQFFQSSNENCITISKVFLNQSEKTYLIEQLCKISKFLSSCQTRSNFQSLSQKEIFYWGNLKYSDLLSFIS